jgi:tetratricopeptide (TPR) repeat protein
MKRRRLLLVIAGALILAGAGVAAAVFLTRNRDVTTSSKAAYEAYKEAIANQRRFYKKEARLGFARALELDPHFAMAMLGLAREAKDDEQAIALIKRAAREEPRLTERERLVVRMELAMTEHKWDDLVKIATELKQKYPDDVRSAMVLAGWSMQRGEADKAIKIFQELLEVDPNNAEAYNQIGYYYGWRGDYDKAVEALERYKFISPDNANPFDSLGEVQAYSGRYNEAIENLNRALAIKPDFVDSYDHLGVAYEGMGEYTKAFDSFVKAADLVDQDDRRRQYYYSAMRAGCENEDTARVEEIHAKLEKIAPSPKYGEIHKAVADAAFEVCVGNPAAAMPKLALVQKKLEDLAAKEPKGDNYEPKSQDGGLLLLTAKALEKQGKTDEAFALWKKVAEPSSPYKSFPDRRLIYEARAHMAEVLARRGDLDAAEKLIAENRKWNPSWAPTRSQEMTVAELRREKVLAAGK